MERLNKIKEAKVQQEIDELKENYKVEKEVSEKIIQFINKRRETIQGISDKRDKLRESEINKLLDKRQEVITMKEEADQ